MCYSDREIVSRLGRGIEDAYLKHGKAALQFDRAVLQKAVWMSDPFALQRFVDAQDRIFPQVVKELSNGRKQSHWMWFIFPQIAGLGFSSMAQRFAIGSRAEAVAYLAHDLLGPRLVECTRLVMGASVNTIAGILGSPDDLKFRSSMTLFNAVSHQPIFADAIATFYPDGQDPATLGILQTNAQSEKP